MNTTLTTPNGDQSQRGPPIRAARNQGHHSNQNQTSPRAIRWIEGKSLAVPAMDTKVSPPNFREGDL
jgi:hypothetical protein